MPREPPVSCGIVPTRHRGPRPSYTQLINWARAKIHEIMKRVTSLSSTSYALVRRRMRLGLASLVGRWICPLDSTPLLAGTGAFSVVSLLTYQVRLTGS